MTKNPEKQTPPPPGINLPGEWFHIFISVIQSGKYPDRCVEQTDALWRSFLQRWGALPPTSAAEEK